MASCRRSNSANGVRYDIKTLGCFQVAVNKLFLNGRHHLTIIILVAVLFWLVGCGGNGSSPSCNLCGPDYKQALDRWTREAKLYDPKNMDLIVGVTATYRSPQFRKSYLRVFSDDYELGPYEVQKMAAGQAIVAGSNVEFLVAVTAGKKEERDLADKQSPWRLYLECPDWPGRLTPFEIRPVKKVTTRLQGYYPYISPWAKVYHVRFLAPGLPLTNELTLVTTGVKGTVRLRFPLED